MHVWLTGVGKVEAVIEHAPAAKVRHVALQVGCRAAIVAAQQVVGGLDPTTVIHVERHLEILKLPGRFRRDIAELWNFAPVRTDGEFWRIHGMLAGVADGIARECLGGFETGGIEPGQPQKSTQRRDVSSGVREAAGRTILPPGKYRKLATLVNAGVSPILGFFRAVLKSAPYIQAISRGKSNRHLRLR